jgi:mannose-6-phosphate isomerase
MAVVVSGTVKDYPWGMIDGVVPWTGRSTGRPQAELWFGVHKAGPSPVADGGSADELLTAAEVPLLVKILAASHPLSIQVHPDAVQAAEGYARQAPSGTIYSDSAEKNEMLVAMSQFQVLAGWKPPARAAAVLAALGYSDGICRAAAEGRWVDATEGVISGLPAPGPWDPGAVRSAIGPDHPLEATALGDLAAEYPQDPGVGVAAALRYWVLDPGDGLYVPAGVPHAYLRGVGLEVMTSSDNVLRLGLTGKEIAIDEALQALHTDRRPVLITGPGGKTASGAPFTVTLQRGVAEKLGSGHYRVVLAVDGPVRVSIGSHRTELAIGQALLIPAADPEAVVASEAMVALVVATQPAKTRR